MFKVLPLSLLAATALLAGCTPPAPSPEPGPSPDATEVLVSEEGAFSIWMPAELEHEHLPVDVVLPSRTLLCYEYFARTSGVYWLARYCELPSRMDRPAAQEAMIDEAQAVLMDEADGRLVSQQDLEVDGFLARRILADSALRGAGFDGRYFAVIAAAPDRLYLISTYGFNEADPSDLETMDRFVSSLRIQAQ